MQKLQQSTQKYDYVQIMLPNDEKRRIVLDEFAKKMYDGNNNYSGNFKKKQNISIVNRDCDEASNNFIFYKPELYKIPKRIQIIDDTISTGCTINIFLDFLKKAELLTGETEVTVTITYNNAGLTKFS